MAFHIENLSKEYKNICIIIDEKNYITGAKILATLNQDEFFLTNKKIILKNAKKISQNSILITLNNSNINLIKFDKELGDILIETDSYFSYFSLLDIDIQSSEILLNSLAKSHEVSLSFSEIISGWSLVKASENKFGELDNFILRAKNLFTNQFIAGENPIKFIAGKLIKNNLKISFAESCTAGLCANILSHVPGISACFDGSLISYSNRLKNEWLKVDNEILKTNSEYSEPCIKQMLLSCLKLSKCDFAIAISGIAGPSSDKNFPVGTVFVGAMDKKGDFLVERHFFKGDREFIQKQSVYAAFACLLRFKNDIFFKV